jgi:hypothetical protein
VAYLNVDSAVAGAGFWASATPSLDRVVLEASKLVRNGVGGSLVRFGSDWFIGVPTVEHCLLLITTISH